jgi:hypothetical protein
MNIVLLPVRMRRVSRASSAASRSRSRAAHHAVFGPA